MQLRSDRINPVDAFFGGIEYPGHFIEFLGDGLLEYSLAFMCEYFVELFAADMISEAFPFASALFLHLYLYKLALQTIKI